MPPFGFVPVPTSCAPAGEQWQFAVSGANPFQKIAVDPATPRIVIAASDGNVKRSSDGLNWGAAIPAGSTNVTIAWSPTLGLFCLAGTNYNGFHTSPDGLTWTPRASTATIVHRSIAWVGDPFNVFVAGDNNPLGSIIAIETSPDAINWTSRTTPDLNDRIEGIAYSPELATIVAVAINGAIMHSFDGGVSWSQQNAPATPSWREVVWSPELGIFCAMPSTGLQCATSVNGVNWTMRNIPIQAAFEALAWTGERFVALGQTGGTPLISSQDGITWTAHAFPTQAWNDVVWTGAPLNMLVACSDTGTSRIAVSQS